jgi:branched-chain amino acid transport system ATP-binding protein
MVNMVQDTLLEVNKVAAYYGSLQVIWDLSLDVKRGEIVALIGSNGSGKTTLLDTISGLHHPPTGSIIFDGIPIEHMDPSEIVSAGITQIPEGRQLFPEMSVLDNLFIGSYNATARRQREENLVMVFEQFPKLEERSAQLAKTLSGGEQQMLAIGRGLMTAPKMILIDEMSLGLAPIMVDRLYEGLKGIRERGITILFVEQNARRSLQEADRAFIMERGRVVLCGETCELREEDKVKKAYFGL